MKELPVPKKGNILADQMVLLGHRGYRTGVPVRRVVVRDPGTGKKLEFLTNQLNFAASTIAKIYRDRWQIETFFKALKQSLRVKHRGYQRQRVKDADLDRPDRHVDLEVSEVEIHLRLVTLQSGGLVAPAVVRIPRPVDLVGLSL